MLAVKLWYHFVKYGVIQILDSQISMDCWVSLKIDQWKQRTKTTETETRNGRDEVDSSYLYVSFVRNFYFYFCSISFNKKEKKYIF